MGFRIEVFEGDTVTKEIALTEIVDEVTQPYDLTGKTVVLRIAAALVDEALLDKSTDDADEASHDDAGGVVSIIFVADDYDLIPAVAGDETGGVAGTVYPATLLIDGDAIETGDVFVKAVVRAPAA